MRIGQFFVNIIFVFIASSSNLFAQINFGSKQMIKSVAIFRDNADPLLFYYEPGNLKLDETNNGAPDFKFLDMRYTGTKCYNDAGEKNFMSLVQFGVVMEKINSKTLKDIKSILKKKYGRISLKPLPVSHIDTRLVLPVENNEEKRHQAIENDGVLEANDKSGFSNSKSFWTKRTFTIRLNKYESQLLNKQLKDKLLGINLNYAYHANVWMPDQEEILGSKELIEQFKKDSIEDTSKNIQNRIIKNHTLTINIDTDTYPDIIQQIDLNEEIPPTYAAIEVKCHDFLENLRPELYMKIVEIEATSVNDGKKVKIKTTFRKKYTDLYTQYINFPYAIDMNTEMRYRVTEIDTNGERNILDWIEKPECESIIDVTSASEAQKISSEIIDIEINPTLFEEETISKIEFSLSFTIHGASKTETLVFSKNDELPLQSIRYAKDKNTKVVYTITKHTLEEAPITSEEKELTENYMYLNSF